MTAREFLEFAGVEVSERNLYLLGQYVGKGDFYASFPDASAKNEDGEFLEELADEPANFQVFLEDHS